MAHSNIPNAYPELPEVPFVRTTVPLEDVVSYLKQSKLDVHIKRASYVLFRNESTRGKEGINNNYIGLQADGGRHNESWSHHFIATCIKKEGMTGKDRRFLCFKNWNNCVDVMAAKMTEQGLYVGGYAEKYAHMHIRTPDDWCRAYFKQWVKGNEKAEISASDKKDLLRSYDLAIGFFGGGGSSGFFSRIFGWGQS